MDQKQQALQYFSSHALDWQNKATRNNYRVIENRHAAVLAVADAQVGLSKFLDIGCGTGQLAIEMSKRGIEATGIDFAPEMIAQCEANKLQGASNARFICGSVFDIEFEPASYDLISAQGFIEYISLKELDDFLGLCRRILKPGGSLALGSRNRLFNLHSNNSFTEIEISLKTVDALLAESIALHGSASQSDALARLMQHERIYVQPDVHPLTGIKVDTRYQFSPGDLCMRMRRADLKPRAVFPVHFHALPPSVIGEPSMAALHAQFASLAQREWIRDVRFVPYSSSFLIEATV